MRLILSGLLMFVLPSLVNAQTLKADAMKAATVLADRLVISTDKYTAVVTQFNMVDKSMVSLKTRYTNIKGKMSEFDKTLADILLDSMIKGQDAQYKLIRTGGGQPDGPVMKKLKQAKQLLDDGTSAYNGEMYLKAITAYTSGSLEAGTGNKMIDKSAAEITKTNNLAIGLDKVLKFYEGE